MAKKKEKKNTSPVFLGVVIACMLVVFVMQMVFPASLGETWGKLTENASEITVTATTGESYSTSSTDEILAFGIWADEVTMRSQSLANRLTADKPLEYTFAIKSLDGTYYDMIIDEKGYVQTGAEVYMVSGDAAGFLAELKQQLESWSGNVLAEDTDME